MSSAAPHVQHQHRHGTIRAAFAYREFRLMFIGMSFSSIGNWMQNFTLPAYIDGRTHSAGLVGLFAFAQLGPSLLLSIPAGVLADRVNRTRLVLGLNVVMLVLTFGLAGLAAADAAIWTIFVVQAMVGIAVAVQAPAFQASVLMMVDRRDLAGAVSLNSVMINGTRILGPSLAALLAAFGLSLPAVIAVNACSYVFLIVPLLFLTLPQPARRGAAGLRALTYGLRTSRDRGVVWRSLATICLFSLFSLPHIGLFPSVARLNWGLDQAGGTYRVLYITWGVGALLGALSIGSVMAHHDKRRMVRAWLIVFAVSLTAFGLIRDVNFVFPVAAMLGFAYFIVATALASILQENLADTERASVMPLWQMSWAGMIPIGAMLAGPVMDALGARSVLVFGGVSAFVVAQMFALGRLQAHHFLPEEHGGSPYTELQPLRRRSATVHS